MRSFAKRHYLLCLIALLFLVFGLSLCFGRYSVSLSDIIYLVNNMINGNETALPHAYQAFFVIRLPRNIAALIVGGALAVAGAVFQGVFKNPMSSPDILGGATGAGFGAALGILLSFPMVVIQSMSFVGGLAAVLLTCLIGRSIDGHNVSPITLVLTGIVVSGIFQAAISLTKYVADPNSTLPSITLWLMGTFSGLGWDDVEPLVPLLVLAMIPMFLLRWRLSVLSMGDEEAQTLGVNVRFLRSVMIVCATFVTSATVAYCGVIGWVGLVIPHLARGLVGSEYSKLLPASLLLGASFTLMVDIVARSLLQVELPLGILTALIGAPFFLVLLKRGKKEWN